MARPRSPRPADGEIEILKVIWAGGAMSINEMHAQMSSRSPVGVNSILKRVQIMEGKGYLRRSRTRRPLRYEAILRESETKRSWCWTWRNDCSAALAGVSWVHALGASKVSKDERDQIKKLLNDQSPRG